MRLAVFADIHGNHAALEAVQTDLAGRAPDVIVNLGDHVSGPLQAAQSADWLSGSRVGAHPRQSRPPVAESPARAHGCHGSPTDDLQYLLEEVRGDRTRLASAAYIQEKLEDVRARLVLCGHTHVPRLVSGVRIVNPGSVGLPAFDDTWTAPHYVENGTPHARYAIIDVDRSAVRVELIAVEYDWDSVREGGGEE